MSSNAANLGARVENRVSVGVKVRSQLIEIILTILILHYVLNSVSIGLRWSLVRHILAGVLVILILIDFPLLIGGKVEELFEILLNVVNLSSQCIILVHEVLHGCGIHVLGLVGRLI